MELVSIIFSKLPYSTSNKLIDFFVQNVSIKKWDNRLLGLSKLPIKTIIDVGANQGQSSKKFARIFPQSIIYAFEPLEYSFKNLKRAVQDNHNIVPFNLALGEREAIVEFYEHMYFSQSSSVLKTTKSCDENYPILKDKKIINVQQKSLDQVINELPGFPSPEILIKLDVQGYEDRVIVGGMETFKKAIACIVEISVDLVYEGQASFKDIFELLDELKFQYVGNIDQVQSQSGNVQYFDAVFIKNSL